MHYIITCFSISFQGNYDFIINSFLHVSLIKDLKYGIYIL